jgi:hypothetical protein
MTTDNLWGDLASVPTVKPPVTILREQAEQLTKLTKGALIGQVVSIKSDYGSPLAFALEIRVPGLNDYEVTILAVHQPLTLYPIAFLIVPISGENYRNVPGEKEFLDAVGKTLTHPKIRELIGALISQVTR